MNHPAAIAGYRILDGRYALLECIAVSSIGKIYRGRDLERIRAQGMDSQILIHLLPSGLDTPPLEALFQQITQTCKQVPNEWVLRLRTYGQAENSRYLVLESPGAAGLVSLEQQPPNRHEVLFKQVSQQVRPLYKKGLLTSSVDPALVVMQTDNSLYLLSSALSPEIQSLQTRRGVFTGKRRFLPAIVAGLAALGMVSAISVLAASYMIEPDKDAVEVVAARGLLAAKEQGVAPVPPLRLASLMPSTHGASVDLSDSDWAMQATASNLINSVNPEKPEKYISPEPRIKLQSAKPSKPAQEQNTSQKQAKREKPVSGNENKQKPAKARQVELREQVTPEPAPVWEQASVTPAPEKVRAPQTLGINELIRLAEQSINAGEFSSDTGALHYTRLLQQQSHLHPQVKRLSRAIVSHYHEQTRAYLKDGNIRAAQQALSAAFSVIKEFNLVSFNDAQQVLEHKTAKLQAE